MKEDNNDFTFGNVLNNIVNDGYKSFENVFNLLYGTKKNNSSFESKDGTKDETDKR